MLGSDYPKEDAAARLERLASDRISTGLIAHPLSQYAKICPSKHFVTSVIDSGCGSTWRLTPTSQQEESQEEIVFTIHGIILHCELPPILRPFGRSASPRHIKQRLLLAGFNTDTFTTALIGLDRIDDLLRLNIREDVPHKLNTQASGQQAIEISNRYFTSKRMAITEEQIEIPTYVDPKGILESIKGENLVHTTENQVEYYQRVTNSNGVHRFINTNPARIHEGDIVEVQFTITLVEPNMSRQNDSKLAFTTKPILRSITLLDNSFSEIYRNLSINRPRRPCLKRKVGHAEEESTETQERLKRMVIDTEK
ncbi:hypothetical protein VNI00_011317 [Paramarasmius palmivorus]|uniref:Uncharacterized protein n=1 Tax=Paramarasmius palmivorus TaxID=297713 RepID=A0AAW0CHJ6_9AGAR